MARESALTSFLRLASVRRDLVIVVIMMTAIMAMILPISPDVADALIGLNMALSVLLLMMAFSVRSPVEFASLPSVILISTVFRLSISIATTRLILTEADGGAIIQTFGDFVISGNVIVGLVVFLIITIVQFVVITKGSERVAEVAARFSLDGLPGKQMSIDSDLRNGDIDQTEARRRRSSLERESQLYGAMDGAMKFVKGDAIAGIIIVAVNLFGGIAVGMVQKGMSFSEAVQVYSLLTIGDGLVAQIPALFVSLTAGTIVTRVANEGSENLGTDIIGQIASKPDALRLAGVVLIVLALIPGFPAWVFVILAALFGGTGYIIYRMQRRKTALNADLAPAAAPLTPVSSVLPSGGTAPVVVAASPDLFAYFVRENVDDRLRVSCQQLSNEMGFACPSVGYRREPRWSGFRYAVELDNIPECMREVDPQQLIVGEALRQDLMERGIAFEAIGAGANTVLAVDAAFRGELAAAEIDVHTVAKVIEADVREVILQNAAYFIGIQETRRLLASLEPQYKDLLREVQKFAPIQRIADVLRRLLEERISIRNLRLILETVLEWAPREQDTNALVNQVRLALKKQICFDYGGTEKTIKALIIERETEDAIRAAIQQAISRNLSAIDTEFSASFLDTIEALAVQAGPEDMRKAVVLTAAELRRAVWTMTVRGGRRLPVLSFQDIAPDFSVRVIGTVRMQVTTDKRSLARTA